MHLSAYLNIPPVYSQFDTVNFQKLQLKYENLSNNAGICNSTLLSFFYEVSKMKENMGMTESPGERRSILQMIKIGICDDMAEEVRKQKAMVQRIAEKLGKNMEIHVFEEGEELLQEIQAYGHMDILLLDIEMEGKNGVEIAKSIRRTDYQTVLIFISAYDQYCKELIGVQPFAFLDKPVTEHDLEKVLKKVLRVKFAENDRFLFSYQKHRYSIPLHQIMYFESIGRKIRIHCAVEQYDFNGKLNAVEQEISRLGTKFARIQVSYYVNLNYIKEWNYDSIMIDDGTEIPISKRYRKMMRQYYMGMLERE